MNICRSSFLCLLSAKDSLQHEPSHSFCELYFSSQTARWHGKLERAHLSFSSGRIRWMLSFAILRIINRVNNSLYRAIQDRQPKTVIVSVKWTLFCYPNPTFITERDWPTLSWSRAWIGLFLQEMIWTLAHPQQRPFFSQTLLFTPPPTPKPTKKSCMALQS